MGDLNKWGLVFCAAVVLLASGCRRELSNDQIIDETKKCEAAGLNTNHYWDVVGDERVKCQPKNE